jgi:hypothetical protein
MSNLVFERECLICACASFASAPAILSQVACDVRKHLQLTHSSPIFRPAGLMKRVRILLSRIGFPSFTDWKTKLSGLEDLTAGNRFEEVAGSVSVRRCLLRTLTLDLPWQKVRESVDVKLFEQEGELYVLAKSEGRQAKEMAMRRKRLTRLLRKLRAMRRSLPSRDQLLMRLGAAKSAAGRAFQFVHLQVPGEDQEARR